MPVTSSYSAHSDAFARLNLPPVEAQPECLFELLELHFHRDVMAICASFPRSTLRAEASDVFCGTPPLGFTFGLGGLLLFPLHIGASTVLMEKVNPESLLQAIERYRVSVLFTAPTFYRMMAPLIVGVDLSSLRKCVSAGEVLPAATRTETGKLQRFKLRDG